MTSLNIYSYGTIQGARDYQEDSFGIYLDMDMQSEAYGNGDLLIVCDGMGGHVGGAEASKMVNETFYETFCAHDFDIPDCLSISLNAANAVIADRIEQEPSMEGMGTTLIAAVLTGTSLYWISVGDSPMWLSRDGKLIRLNKDHSMAPVLDKMAAIGELSVEDALADVTRNQLRSAIVGDNVSLVDLTTQAFDVQHGDVLILATDGVETLTPDRIQYLVDSVKKKPDSAADVILKDVDKFQDPHQDNATCIVAHIKTKETGGFLSKLFG